jgi:hypothetical protein
MLVIEAVRPTWLLLLLLPVLLLASCRGHIAHIYSGVDPAITVQRADSIELVLPDDASIRERNAAVLVREELRNSGFHLVEEGEASIWTLSFGLDRRTYTIGSKTTGVAVGFDVVGVPAASLAATTTLVSQTDVTIFMHLLKTADLRSPRPLAVWEGSVTTKDKVFAVLPNAVLAELLKHFGENFEHPTRVDRSYQREVNRKKRQEKANGGRT